MIKKEWKVSNNSREKSLIERLLSVRGIVGEENIKDFLNPYEITLTHPNAFCDMKKCVERIVKAIDTKEKILIYGDFDADGVTSTSLLVKTLRYLGADVEYFIPTRELDGHGLSSNALIKLTTSIKPSLFITVDCGISNVVQVDLIKSFGKDIIITDHHEAPEVLPNAYGIINPKAPNSLDESLSAKEIRYLNALAGVGVAFKLAQGILEHYNKLEYSLEILPFVAIGTIADVMPLIGENRYYVLKGLDLISKGRHYGLKRLLETAGYNDISSGVTSEQIAFGIAPRINACGRLDSVEDAVKVLISENTKEIELSVMSLDHFNKIRQQLCSDIFAEADEMAKKSRDNVLVLFKKDWHIGIIGIVASKLVDKYSKPTFLMTYSEETNQIRCSARGIEGCEDLNLFEIISNISDKLDGFGGHSLAAGLYFSPEKSSFEEVKSALIQSYNIHMNSKKPVQTLTVDMELECSDITEDLIKDISRLEPYGASNPLPLFVVKDFKLVKKSLMGSTHNHLRLTVEKDGETFVAIWWHYGDIYLKPNDTLDIAFSPQLNTFNGRTSIQLIIRDIHSDCFVEPEETKVITYDNRRKTDIIDKVNDYLKTSKFDFVVFAEKNTIVNSLKAYPEIYKRIVNRYTLKQSDGLMFFDYPPTEEMMDDILNIVSPIRIHYMNYNIDSAKSFDYIKTMAGMIKYVCKSKDGQFDLNNSATFLGITTQMVEELLECFESCGSIKILDRGDDAFVISYINPASLEDIKSSEDYEVFSSSLTEVIDTREYFLNREIVTI